MTQVQANTPVIAARNLAIAFGKIQALNDVSLDLHSGEVLALVGDNGAGKSSLLSVLQGARRPDSGHVSAFGHQPDTIAARARFGIVLQEIDFPEQLTPVEILRFAAAHFADPLDISETIETFGLGDLAHRRTLGFSMGQKRRVALALAFMGRPKVIFLDEPTAGLDGTGQELITREVIKFRAQGGSVILTSHVWSDVETLADRVIVLEQGQKILEHDAAYLRQALSSRFIRFEIQDGFIAPSWFEQVFTQDNSTWQAWSDEADQLVTRLCTEQIPFRDLYITRPDLRATITTLAQHQRADL